MTAVEDFTTLLARTPVTTDEALALFDSLDPVSVDEMIGQWWGSEFPTGHPMDGLLAATGWAGKRFDSADEVHPLLFWNADRSDVFAVDPALVPMNLPLPSGARKPWLHKVITLGRPVMGTSKYTARLRMTEYRGVSSATMIYDARPINDVFHRVDASTLLGCMDLRDAAPYFFVLRR
ncbi:DUF4334 domain-containing protein [Actinomycetospora corticicola]|uniref:GXWXG protein n=1 Tax=Actinomycetospora corticicola TaxID=663602 RepID=A0A7Y9E190_9PSEU|nr:DUF4334 domain-containing protein [Actinomycetospora corticicola]NYD39192.1 hypothetical protein [Actinomycetospora corticicola]